MSEEKSDKKPITPTTSTSYSSSSWGSKGGPTSWGGSWWGGKKKKSYKSRLGFGRFYGDDDDDLGHYSSSSGYSRKSSSYYGGGSSYYGGSYYGKYTSYYTPRVSREKKEADEKFIKTAYQEAKDLVNVLDFPFKVNIYMDVEGKRRETDYFISNSSDRSIYISSRILEDSTKTEEQKLEIFSGIAIHEAAHLLFTKLEDFKTCFGDSWLHLGDDHPSYRPCLVGKFLEKIKIDYNTSTYISIIKFLECLAGLIEDEQVELNLLEERQGWFNYIESQKNYYRTTYKKNISAKIDEKIANFVEFVSTLVDVIRYQNNIDETIVKKYDKSFQEVYKIIQDFPKSTYESIIKALQLFKICLGVLMANDSSIDDIFVPENTSEEEKDEVVGDSIKGGTGLSLDDEMLKALLEFFSEDINKTKSRKSLSTATDLIDSSCIMSSIPVNGSDESRTLSTRDKLSDDQIKVTEKDLLDVSRGVFSKGSKSNVVFRHPLGDSKAYERELKEVSQYIPTMRSLVKNMNKNYDFCIHGQREGKLDTTKLVEAYQGVPQVYTKTGVVRTSGVNICVVIDESGSMSGYRSNKARKAAILMNEAFGNIPGVDLYIYGHTADLDYGDEKSTDIYVYREPGIPYVKKMGTGLSNVKGRYENRDGQAIREIAYRVRKFTSQPVLMFVLSDGMPCAYDYWGPEAVKDVGDAVKEIGGMGFYPIQITIDNSSLDEKTIKKMFNSFVDLTDTLDQLPKSLSSVVRKEVAKALQDNQSLTTI